METPHSAFVAFLPSGNFFSGTIRDFPLRGLFGTFQILFSVPFTQGECYRGAFSPR
jgi:hypothetical protein